MLGSPQGVLRFRCQSRRPTRHFLIAPVISSKATAASPPHSTPLLAFREYEVGANAPFAWVTESVLQEIALAAASGRLDQTHGTLFGHWVAANREVVISDWGRFGRRVHRQTSNASDGPPSHDSTTGSPVAGRVGGAIGTWLRTPNSPPSKSRPRGLVAQLAPAGATTGLVLLLTREGANGWAPRLWLDPAARSPWARLRRPLRMRLRVFVAPGKEAEAPPRTL